VSDIFNSKFKINFWRFSKSRCNSFSLWHYPIRPIRSHARIQIDISLRGLRDNTVRSEEAFADRSTNVHRWYIRSWTWYTPDRLINYFTYLIFLLFSLRIIETCGAVIFEHINVSTSLNQLVDFQLWVWQW
jgi:hypothetical protein